MKESLKVILPALVLFMADLGAIAAPKQARATKATTASAQKSSARTTAAATRINRGGTASVGNATLTSDVEDSEAVKISTRLRDECLKDFCAGEFAWESCFGRSDELEEQMNADKKCTTILASSKNDNIRKLAIKKVKEYVATKFYESCRDKAGGYLDGVDCSRRGKKCETRDKDDNDLDALVDATKCKVTVFYQAKSTDLNTNKSIGWKDNLPQYPLYPEIGQQFSCTSSNFNVPDSAMYYRPELTAEQEIEQITAGVNMGVAGLTGVMHGFSLWGASKAEKNASLLQGDYVYRFDGRALNKVGACKEYTPQKNSCSSARLCGASVTSGLCQDSAGNCYNANESKEKGLAVNVCSGSQGGALVTLTDSTIQCGAVRIPDWQDKKCLQNGQATNDPDCKAATQNCWVRIEQATAANEAATAASLIKQSGRMEQLAAEEKANREKNALRSQVTQQAAMMAIGKTMTGAPSQRVTIGIINLTQADAGTISCESFNKNGQYNNVSMVPVYEGGKISRYECQGTIGGEGDSLVGADGKLNSTIDSALNIIEGTQPDSSKTSEFYGMTNAYQGYQNTANAKAEEIAGYRSQKEEAKAGLAEVGSQLLSGTLTMIFTEKMRKDDKKLMEGSCWLYREYDKSKTFLVGDGMGKRIGWSN